ncbi:hypothetical protein [Streptosporangium vulgare]|uniref:Uncharacterized protein n=1 Tax=Streptosporangium vulgare TaxID=46190 RepID=A0ABV5TMU0_9ACTN
MHLAKLEAADVVLIDGLPVTTAERTVVDLLAARVDGAHVGGVITDADRYGLTNRDSLGRRVARFAAAYGLPRSASGRQLLEYLAEQADTGLPVKESTRLRQEDVVEGFVSALALLSALDENQVKQLFADHPGILAGLRAQSASSLAGHLAKSEATPLPTINRQASQEARSAARPRATKANQGGADLAARPSTAESSDKTSSGEAK